ncbi:GntR family transcriptional regulator, partial [Actinacidiphila rubida]
ELLIAEAREMLDAGSAGGPAGLAELNTRFHQVLAEASGSPTLAALVAQLGYKISWVYSLGHPRRAPESWAEHEGIVQALRDRDPDAARERVAEHIRRAQAAYRLRGKH